MPRCYYCGEDTDDERYEVCSECSPMQNSILLSAWTPGPHDCDELWETGACSHDPGPETPPKP